MTLSIQRGKSLENITENVKIQLMPFKIAADESANVKDMFDVNCKEEADGFTNSFRGYPLKGKRINIPDGYRGIVLKETKKPMSENDNRKLYVLNNFNSIFYWNWGKEPSENDPIIQVFDHWIDIAEALHSPVTSCDPSEKE